MAEYGKAEWATWSNRGATEAAGGDMGPEAQAPCKVHVTSRCVVFGVRVGIGCLNVLRLVREPLFFGVDII